jgi:dihydrofolate synthase/folylpolyglutamate synthase
MINQLKKDNIHFVFGMVNDKDATKILNLLPKNWKYYFAKANIPRGLNTSELIEKAKCLNIKGKAYTSVKKAFSSAKLSAKENDLVFIGGSIFVVAEVL